MQTAIRGIITTLRMPLTNVRGYLEAIHDESPRLPER